MNILIAMGIGKGIGLLCTSKWLIWLFPPYVWVKPEMYAQFYDREFINNLKLVV